MFLGLKNSAVVWTPPGVNIVKVMCVKTKMYEYGCSLMIYNQFVAKAFIHLHVFWLTPRLSHLETLLVKSSNRSERRTIVHEHHPHMRVFLVSQCSVVSCVVLCWPVWLCRQIGNGPGFVEVKSWCVWEPGSQALHEQWRWEPQVWSHWDHWLLYSLGPAQCWQTQHLCQCDPHILWVLSLEFHQGQQLSLVWHFRALFLHLCQQWVPGSWHLAGVLSQSLPRSPQNKQRGG